MIGGRESDRADRHAQGQQHMLEEKAHRRCAPFTQGPDRNDGDDDRARERARSSRRRFLRVGAARLPTRPVASHSRRGAGTAAPLRQGRRTRLRHRRPSSARARERPGPPRAWERVRRRDPRPRARASAADPPSASRADAASCGGSASHGASAAARRRAESRPRDRRRRLPAWHRTGRLSRAPIPRRGRRSPRRARSKQRGSEGSLAPAGRP